MHIHSLDFPPVSSIWRSLRPGASHCVMDPLELVSGDPSSEHVPWGLLSPTIPTCVPNSEPFVTGY